jgi:hypothetical protein
MNNTFGDTIFGGVLVEKELREYRTGQGVPVEGSYICQSGAKATLKKDDIFPQCPVSNQDTHWEHDNSES